jgi:hypothetical protein
MGRNRFCATDRIGSLHLTRPGKFWNSPYRVRYVGPDSIPAQVRLKIRLLNFRRNPFCDMHVRAHSRALLQAIVFLFSCKDHTDMTGNLPSGTFGGLSSKPPSIKKSFQPQVPQSSVAFNSCVIRRALGISENSHNPPLGDKNRLVTCPQASSFLG